MRTSAASRRPTRRPLAAVAVLTLALVGLVPGVAHAADPIPGGETQGSAVPLEMTDATATFTTSNLHASPPTGGGSGSFVWYSFQPQTSGLLDLELTAFESTPPYDTIVEVWSEGLLRHRNDDCNFGGGNLNSCLDALSVVGATTYLIGVGGFDGWEGHVSQGTAALTLTLTAPPTRPLDVAVVPGDGAAVVSWSAPSHPYGDVVDYRVRYRTLPDGDWAVQRVPGTELSTTLAGLANGTRYAVRIRATTVAGLSTLTEVREFTPQAPSSVVLTPSLSAPVSGDPYSVRVEVFSHEVLVLEGTIDFTTPLGSATVTNTSTQYLTGATSAGDHVYSVVFSGTAAVAPSSASVTVTVSKLGQTVTLDPLPASPVFAGAPVTLVGSSSRGLPVTFAASGACTVTGDQLSFTGVGECTVTASQAGTSEVHAAFQTRVVTVAKRPQTLAVTGLPVLVTGNGQFSVSGVSDVGLPVTLAASGACTISGGVVTVVDVGTCTVTASQAGDEHTLPATATATATVVGTPASASLRIGFAVGDQVEATPVTVTGAGLRPGTPLTLTVYSTPTQVGTTAASVLGSAVTIGELPALEAGEHRVVARGTALDGERVTTLVRFAVDENGVVTRIGAPADLATSGTTTDTTGLLALLWLVAGAGLIVIRRNLGRRTATT